MDKDKMEGYFNLGIFLLAMVFAAISVFSLYGSFNNLISIWFDYKYLPIFQIAFNLAILIICIFLIRERLIKR